MKSVHKIVRLSSEFGVLDVISKSIDRDIAHKLWLHFYSEFTSFKYINKYSIKLTAKKHFGMI